MTTLRNTLEDNGFELVENNLFAAWLDDDRFFRDEETVNGMLRNLNLNHLRSELLDAQENGLLSLTVDDRALLVELL